MHYTLPEGSAFDVIASGWEDCLIFSLVSIIITVTKRYVHNLYQ